MAFRLRSDGPASTTPGRRAARTPRPLRALAVVAACALALAAGALAYDQLLPAPSDEHSKAAHRRSTVKLSGHVESLYPGVPGTLEVRAVNRTHRRLVLTKVKARARTAGPGCPASAIAIRPARPRAKLAPRGSVSVRLHTMLLPDSPPACEGATWPLRFRARATSSGRPR